MGRLGRRLLAPVLAIGALAMPAAAVPVTAPADALVGTARVLAAGGLITAVLAAVFTNSRLVTATAVQAVGLTGIGLFGYPSPGSVAFAAAEAVLIGGYLLAAELAALTWPPGTVLRRVSSAALVLIGSVAIVAGATLLPVAASAGVALGGLAATIAGYLLAVADRPRPAPRPSTVDRPAPSTPDAE
jgi:hypothetical protein